MDSDFSTKLTREILPPTSGIAHIGVKPSPEDAAKRRGRRSSAEQNSAEKQNSDDLSADPLGEIPHEVDDLL